MQKPLRQVDTRDTEMLRVREEEVLALRSEVRRLTEQLALADKEIENLSEKWMPL